jgi:hypothetical protein
MSYSFYLERSFLPNGAVVQRADPKKFICQQWLLTVGWQAVAQSSPEKEKRHHYHIYDDQTIENMVRYYKVEENFDILLRYIKSRGLKEDVL